MGEQNMESEILQVEIIRNLEALKPFADRWNRLTEDAPQRTPMLSHAWVSTYFEHFLEPGESWFCLMVLRGDELLGVLPVIQTPAKLAGFDRPLLRTPFNLHTASVDFILKKDVETEIVRLLLNNLDSISKNRIALELLRIPAASPSVSLLDGRLPGFLVIREFNGRGSFLDTTGDFDEYRASLRHNFSRNLTKAHNKISKLPDVKARFFSGVEALPEMVDMLMKIEASGWKGEAGTAIVSSNTTRNFYRDLTRRLSNIGWLEWHFLYTEDRPIAVHFGIKLGRTLILNKIGFDEEFARYSPGNILFEEAVKRAFDSDDTDEINCLTDMAWHDNWKMIKKDYYDFWIYPLRPVPMIFGVLPKKIRSLGRRIPVLKSLYKRFRSLIAGGSK